MCPIDSTPHGGEVLHELPEGKKFPKPTPDHEHGHHPGGVPVDAVPGGQSEPQPDIAHRPAIPAHTERLAVDIEDEEADPVIDTGPGIDR